MNMNKASHILFLFLMLAFLFGSCKKKYDKKIELSTNSLHFNCKEDRKTVNLGANQNFISVSDYSYNIEENISWLSVHPASGEITSGYDTVLTFVKSADLLNYELGKYEGIVEITFDDGKHHESISVEMEVCDEDVDYIENLVQEKLEYTELSPYPGPEAQRYLGFVIEKDVYVLNTSDSRVFAYNTSSNSWNETDAFPTSTQDIKESENAVSFNNKGYILKDNQLYAFNKDNIQKWELLPIQTASIILESLVSTNDSLYAFSKKHNKVELYSIDLDNFTINEEATLACSNSMACSMISIGNNIFYLSTEGVTKYNLSGQHFYNFPANEEHLYSKAMPISIKIGDRIYYGCGENENSRIEKYFYEFNSTTGAFQWVNPISEIKGINFSTAFTGTVGLDAYLIPGNGIKEFWKINVNE